MIIYQGSNVPITITFDEEATLLKDIHVILSKNEDTVLKHWTLDDVVFDDIYTISCPLTQQETLDFPQGYAVLEVKWLDGENYVQFSQKIDVTIAQRYDKHILGE